MIRIDFPMWLKILRHESKKAIESKLQHNIHLISDKLMISTTDQYGFSKSIPINKLANYKCKLILADKLAFSTDTIERIGESCAEKYSNANE